MSVKKSLSRLIGIIGKPHGIKGYLYVRMFTDYPDAIAQGDFLYLDQSCTKELSIEDKKHLVSKGGNRTIFKFAGIDDRSGAENLRGNNLYRKAGKQPALDEDMYWVEDLIGCKVYLVDNTLLGTVKDVENYISNDNLVVQINGMETGNDKNKNKNIIIIPMIEDYLAGIDIKNKKIILKKLPEYV